MPFIAELFDDLQADSSGKRKKTLLAKFKVCFFCNLHIITSCVHKQTNLQELKILLYLRSDPQSVGKLQI